MASGHNIAEGIQHKLGRMAGGLIQGNSSAAEFAVPSPMQLFLVVLSTLFTVETFVMYLLPLLGLTDRGAIDNFADSFLLTCISAPFLWRLIVQPLHRMALTEIERTTSVLGHVIDGVVIFDENGIIESVNSAAAGIFDCSTTEMVGRHMGILLQEMEPAKRDFLGSIPAIGHDMAKLNHEIIARRPDGKAFSLDLSISKARLDGKWKYIGIMRDVTERKRIEEQLLHLANHDSLTGLPNRTLFQDRLNQALALNARSNGNVCVMVLDLDQFKLINDTLGHTMGDRLLQGVAERLKKCFRQCDTVARLGGDEFTVVLPNVSGTHNVINVAQKILNVFTRPFDIGGRELFITASIGITLSPLDGDTADILIKNADTAMYHAKEQGRNNYQFFSAEMNTLVFERLALETSLRHAIERREFVLHYQPRLDLASGKVIGMEALVRWQHPEMGMISPSRFIPLAEETGLIVPIGEWVLHTACEQNRRWQDQGLAPLRVAVNLSAVQFRQQNLVEVVGGILEKTGLSPSWLELELTESIIMQNVEQTIQRLHDLKRMGVELSIDDFGTGYSSLSYLKRFPINTLKIDQSFVRDLATNPDDAAIVKTIITMAHNLGLKVTAEGVENAGQLAFLREYACEEMQGFYFSRPLTAEAFAALIREGKKLVG